MIALETARNVNNQFEELERRLVGRGTEGPEERERRLATARVELAAFDRESTLGLVRLYFGEFKDALGGIDGSVATSELSMDLESDLNSSLDALFGPLN